MWRVQERHNSGIPQAMILQTCNDFYFHSCSRVLSRLREKALPNAKFCAEEEEYWFLLLGLHVLYLEILQILRVSTNSL